jgi:hypothetical protein
MTCNANTSHAQNVWFNTMQRAREIIAQRHVQHDAHMHAYDMHQHALLTAWRVARDRARIVAMTRR